MSEIIGYSIFEPTSEAEYLRRELSIQWRYLDKEDLVYEITKRKSVGLRTLLITNTDSDWKVIYASVPQDSVIVLQLSDETLNEDVCQNAKSASITKIFRNYSISSLSLPSFATISLFCLISCLVNRLDFQSAFSSLRHGFRMRQRAGQLLKSTGTKIIEFPLGYTNKFSDELVNKLGLDSQNSLFKSAMSLITTDDLEDYVVFSGGPGGFPRQLAFEESKKSKRVQIKVSSAGWNGTIGIGSSANEYVDSLLRSKFALCPPGTVSNESFRFFEALICNAMPIASSYTLTQGTKTNLYGTGNCMPFWNWKIRTTRLRFRNTRLHKEGINNALNSIIDELDRMKKEIVQLGVANVG